MIPHTELQWQVSDWQQDLRDAIRTPRELAEFLGLGADDLNAQVQADADFPVLVPLPFARRMVRGDANDPLLRQVMPHGRELDTAEGYIADPLEESHSNPKPGLIHKYRGRVLLIAAPACAVNCRYCFRRHFDYDANNPSRKHWPQSLAYIAADESITEVILSGGDPLMLNDALLAELITRLEAIPHVQRLRIHTRLPVVIPARVTQQLAQSLQATRLQAVVVIHSNHPSEIDDEVEQAMALLRATDTILLNQSVLLTGVNDCAKTLAELSTRLFRAGVMPYYLHLLDKVKGAAHFDMTESRALAIYRELMASSSGYLVPRLVRESPSIPSKMPLAPYDPAQSGVLRQ